MRPLEVAILGTLLMMILFLSQIQSAPYRDDDLLDQPVQAEIDDQTLARWFRNHLDEFRRNRRTRLNAGFNSRHSVVHQLFKAQEAARQAEDPYGPGKRK